MAIILMKTQAIMEPVSKGWSRTPQIAEKRPKMRLANLAED